jgi:4-amino-4-deoxy-L-arabinose transferase-like glycosyltransferase
MTTKVAERFRIVLALIIIYQVMMYGWVARMYMHVSVVLLPWLINQPDYRLYDNINIGYAPGYMWFNALFYQLIPDHLLRLRLGTILIASLITLLVFVQARRWWNIQVALLSALLFALWGPLMVGYMMYFEFTLGLLALGAVMVWHRYSVPGWRPFVAGLLVGSMILIKQPALVVIGIFWIWRLVEADRKKAIRDILLFSAGIVIPLALVGGVLASQGVLERGLFLMTTYNRPYATFDIQLPDLQDGILLALWLGLIPLFAYYTWSAPQETRIKGLLLVGLTVALFFPAFPRYGRFHLSGALPFVALMSAGAIHYLFQTSPSRVFLPVRLYGLGILISVVILGAVLPIYYRIRLGPISSQYGALIAASEWVKQETRTLPGTRMWVLPDIDPTGNFYPISAYQPPIFYTNTYPWFFVWPELTEQVIDGLEMDPPQYVLLFDQWRSQIEPTLWEYVEQHYVPLVETQMPDELGLIKLYQRKS